ncbi:uncharacterized protein LKV04_021932 [Tautogolabrus adspersus]
MLKFYVLFVLLHRAEGTLLYAHPGQNVTLSCSFGPSALYLNWYKQFAGEEPQIISSFFKSASNRFHNHFKNDKRFSVHTGAEFYNLLISQVQDSDSAMYYCGHTVLATTEFYKGIFLVLKESSHKSYILQPASDSVLPGGSVNLSCAVRTGTCDGEHDVYWFKKDSINSPLGIMYINAHSSSQCGRDPGGEPPERRCVYSLSKRNVSVSDAGTYYCAVAHCGDILFGNGTRLEVGRKEDDLSTVLMYCVAAALLVSVILNIILICLLSKMIRRRRLYSGGLQHQSTVQDFTADDQNTDLDTLQYVALDFKKGKRKSRRQRSTEEETVYSAVRNSADQD